MPRGSTFSQAQVMRVLKVAREVDPTAIVEVTRDVIRIIPAAPAATAKEVDDWYAKN